ncbi:hypothetical protein KEJ32_05930, partial [Candidatus Bathyarchaeota archaeon]|nr:hypothetical protein [Candidatus Bathyarchaeota archaeon]
FQETEPFFIGFNAIPWLIFSIVTLFTYVLKKGTMKVKIVIEFKIRIQSKLGKLEIKHKRKQITTEAKRVDGHSFRV